MDERDQYRSKSDYALARRNFPQPVWGVGSDLSGNGTSQGIEGNRYRKRRFIPRDRQPFHFLLGVQVGVTAALTRIVYGSTFRKGLPAVSNLQEPGACSCQRGLIAGTFCEPRGR